MATVTAAFSEAFSAYTEVARPAREPAAMIRYATRTALMLAEYQRAHGQFPEAHSALLQGYRQVRSCPVLHWMVQSSSLRAVMHQIHSNHLCTAVWGVLLCSQVMRTCHSRQWQKQELSPWHASHHL